MIDCVLCWWMRLAICRTVNIINLSTLSSILSTLQLGLFSFCPSVITVKIQKTLHDVFKILNLRVQCLVSWSVKIDSYPHTVIQCRSAPYRLCTGNEDVATINLNRKVEAARLLQGKTHCIRIKTSRAEALGRRTSSTDVTVVIDWRPRTRTLDTY